MSAPRTIAVVLNDRTAQLLRTNSMHDFRVEQPGRFVLLDGDLDFPDPEIIDGTLHWCATAADALLLRAYEQACGHAAYLYSDEASGGMDPFVVLTARPWAEVWGRRS